MTKQTERSTKVAEYLKRPYHRVLVPDSSGTYSAEIEEFAGCFAVGETAGEAVTNLEEVAESWLESEIDRNRPIPEPFEEHDFSGRFVLRLSKSLHAKAARAAQRDGVSLNSFISNCVSECVGVRSRPHTEAPPQQTV